MSNNLIDSLFAHEHVKSDDKMQRVAVRFVDGTSLTYGELYEASAQYAHALKALGVQVGDRVCVQVEKSIDKVMLYLGTLRLGAVFLPLNTAYTLHELRFFIADASPRVVVCDAPKYDALKPIAEQEGVQLMMLGADRPASLSTLAAQQAPDFPTVSRRADDLAVILYTSGTTGRPKGAMVTHENLASNIRALFEVWAYSEKDVLIHALPIFHAHGLFVACNLTLYAGAQLIFLDKFDPAQVIAAMVEATVFMGVPTFYTRLLAHEGFTKACAEPMRLFISGSAPMPLEVHKRFYARTQKVVLERYGMTETVMNTANPTGGKHRQGTVGLPLPGTSVRAADPETGVPVAAGEIGVLEVKGPNVFKGYWQLPDKTAEEFRSDGFFITGDLGTISDDGYVTIVGRAKDLIISGGYNVYPKEVEQHLDQIATVKEAAVIGVPHPDWGEAVVAVLVVEGPPLPEAEVLATLKEKLAAYKVPKHVVYLEALPRNAMSKVQKQVLREQFVQLAASGKANRPTTS